MLELAVFFSEKEAKLEYTEHNIMDKSRND